MQWPNYSILAAVMLLMYYMRRGREIWLCSVVSSKNTSEGHHPSSSAEGPKISHFELSSWSPQKQIFTSFRSVLFRTSQPFDNLSRCSRDLFKGQLLNSSELRSLAFIDHHLLYIRFPNAVRPHRRGPRSLPLSNFLYPRSRTPICRNDGREF